MQTTVKMKFQLIERIVLSLCFLAAIALFTAHHSGSLADTGHSDAGCCLCLAHQASGTGANPSGSVLVTTSASAAGDDAVLSTAVFSSDALPGSIRSRAPPPVA